MKYVKGICYPCVIRVEFKNGHYMPKEDFAKYNDEIEERYGIAARSTAKEYYSLYSGANKDLPIHSVDIPYRLNLCTQDEIIIYLQSQGYESPIPLSMKFYYAADEVW